MRIKTLVVLALFLISIPLVFAIPPKVTLKADPLNGDSPLTVKVSEESGDKTIVKYEYDWGDGSKVSNLAKDEHVYGLGGTYKLVLTVWNNKGEQATDIIEITVISASTKVKENTTYSKVISGSSNITDLLATKTDPAEKASVLTVKTDDAMKPVKFPFVVKSKTSVITIEKYRCDYARQVCGYWLTATRNGQEVQLNTPVWISPPPYDVAVSESYSALSNTLTTTIKEDPVQANFLVLQEYVDRQPLGKAAVGTKE